MKPILLIIVAALAAGNASAADKAPPPPSAPKPASASAAKAPQAKGSAHDAHALCYLAGEAYSEGTVVEGRECRRRPTGDVFAGDEQPLTWQRPGRDPQITQ